MKTTATSTPRIPDTSDTPDADTRPRTGEPKVLDRGYGDEHGGYLADREAEHGNAPPERETIPGERKPS